MAFQGALLGFREFPVVFFFFLWISGSLSFMAVSRRFRNHQVVARCFSQRFLEDSGDMGRFRRCHSSYKGTKRVSGCIQRRALGYQRVLWRPRCV